MAIVKTYSVAADITAGACDPSSMSREIEDSGTVTDFNGIDLDGDVLDVRGGSINDEPGLDAVVLAHDGLPKSISVDRAFRTAHFFEEGNTNATTITGTASTDWEDLNISLAENTLNSLNAFSASGNTITKNSAPTNRFLVIWTIDGLPAAGGNRIYSLKIFKNGTTETDGISQITVSAARNSSRTLKTIVQLAQNDTLDFKVRADSDVINFIGTNNSIIIKRAS